MKMKLIHGILFLSFFCNFIQVKSQTIIDLNDVSLEVKSSSIENLKSLINDVHPSIYFVNQEQNIVEEKNPIKIVADGSLLNKVASATFNKNGVQLIEIRIDLNSFQKQFIGLKYITFIFTYDYCLSNQQKKSCIEKKIEETLQDYSNNNIQITYLLSVND
jgi:hypothetical protein